MPAPVQPYMWTPLEVETATGEFAHVLEGGHTYALSTSSPEEGDSGYAIQLRSTSASATTAIFWSVASGPFIFRAGRDQNYAHVTIGGSAKAHSVTLSELG